VNVALAGSPKIDGWGAGAPLHASPELHGGAGTGCVTQGTAGVQTCASYTSPASSTSCEVNLAPVRKNTSLPLTLASKKLDGSDDVPEEISDRQPSLLALNVVLVAVQLPVPSGSNSYTSSLLFTSPERSPSELSKNTRPRSDTARGW
jgi:hypothetical protein